MRVTSVPVSLSFAGREIQLTLHVKYAVLADDPVEVAVLEVGRVLTQPDGHTSLEPIKLAWLPGDVEGLLQQVVTQDAGRFVVAEVEAD